MASEKLFKVICIVITTILTISASAEPIRVVATGDSLTNGYEPFLPVAAEDTGLSFEFINIADGGLRASQYNGVELHPFNSELKNYALEVIDEEPDYILFMLGTNDCASDTQSEERFLTYKENMLEIFDIFSSSSSNPQMYVSTLIPIITGSRLSANGRINDWYNPWIQETVEDYGFYLVDMNTSIQQVNNWQSMYTDGVHLTAEGRLWMAEEWIDAITPIPEPASILLLGMGGFALQRKRSR